MKNKTKPQKKKDTSTVKQPEIWYLMSGRELLVTDIAQALGDTGYETEIWPQAGVMEIILGEKTSVDVEELEMEFDDPAVIDFVNNRQVKAIYCLTVPAGHFEQTKILFERILPELQAFLCADTPDFMPIYEASKEE